MNVPLALAWGMLAGQTQPPPKAAEPKPAAAKSAPAPRSNPSADRAAVALVAARFFDALLGGRAEELASLCRNDFSFDGHRASGAEDLKVRWAEVFTRRDGGKYTLYDIDLLSAAEAVARWGKPPKRI